MILVVEPETPFVPILTVFVFAEAVAPVAKLYAEVPVEAVNIFTVCAPVAVFPKLNVVAGAAIFNVVAAPAKLTVVAVVFHKFCVVCVPTTVGLPIVSVPAFAPILIVDAALAKLRSVTVVSIKLNPVVEAVRSPPPIDTSTVALSDATLSVFVTVDGRLHGISEVGFVSIPETRDHSPVEWLRASPVYDPRYGSVTIALPWLPRIVVVVPGFGTLSVTVPAEAVGLIFVAVCE